MNQQFNVYGSSGPMNPEFIVETSVNGTYVLPPIGRLRDGQTLELRADLIQINKQGVWAGMDFVWLPDIYGYSIAMDQDNIALWKFNIGAIPGGGAWFFHQHPALKSNEVTMVLSLTRAGSELRINTRVLDKENANAVLFDYTVTDTSSADPTLPNRAVLGALSGPDRVGTPWPFLSGPSGVALFFLWTDPVNGTRDNAEATFDNVVLRLYDPPQLTIEPAVIVSWPVSPGNWILEWSGQVEGSYSELPLSQSVVGSRVQVAVPISEQARFFRLRL